MWRRSASFILDDERRRTSNSPPMADNTTRAPFQNPDAISAYYQTRAAHHGVITSDWLAQAQAAVGGVSGEENSDSSVSELGKEKSFNVIEEFNGWRKQPDLAEAVAAIRALAAVIRASEASTMMELEIELKKASDTLKSWDKTSISLTAGCDLFIRYVTRTSALEYEDFNSAKSRLLERAEKFGEISCKARKIIAMLSQDFIFDGCTILVHGLSRVVLEILKTAAQNNKLFRVLCTEGRPDGTGVLLSNELSKLDIPVKLLLDSAVAYSMDEVDMVFVGADGVVESGGIINMMGTYQIALVAHSMSKPVYVAAAKALLKVEAVLLSSTNHQAQESYISTRMATPNATGNCPTAMKASSNGAFQNENPLDYALPLIILQICLVVVFTRLLAYLLKPLKQPRVIAEIIGGILLGPTALGRSKVYLDTIFPEKSMTVLDTLANIGLLFFLFLVGLELDFAAIRKTGKKSLLIALAGISLPFVIGVGASFILSSTISKGVHQLPFIVFMGVALSITAFPVLARILAELKLLTTDVGRMAMSAAGVNDIAAWIFLALAIALSGNDSSSLVPLWVLLSGSGFVIFAILVIKPILGFMAKRCPEGEPVKELYVCVTLTLVLAASFLTDTIGIHALFGAFVVGIVTPKQGPFCRILTEKIEDLVSGLLLPLYFASSGLKTDVTTIRGAQSWGLLVLVILTTCFGKIVGTVGASMLCKVPFREAMALGVLMNTKGLVELIVLNIGKDRKVLNDQVFAILVLMALVTTFITTPLLLAIYKPARKGAPYKHRTIQRKDHDSELRILACFHSTRNIPTLINMIESSRGTGLKGRLCVYAMHLMELSERSSAIAMVHKARYNGLPIWNKIERSTDQMVIAFEGYQHLRAVAVRPMTAISDLSTIHEDICTSAHQKRVAMILLPFHKHQRMDGAMESIGHAFHEVNKRVLQQAPCSVGILVDRGLGGASHVVASEVDYKIVVPFFGGLDDREALAYGMKMVEHPGITLTILKFVASRGTLKRFEKGEEEEDEKKEKEIDEEFVRELMNDPRGNESLAYEERVVESKEDVRATLKATSKCNLFVVGRNAAVVPLVNSTDCPELGPVGRLLSSSEFSTTASVLVVQGYDSAADTRPVVEDDDYEQSSREIGDSTV